MPLDPSAQITIQTGDKDELILNCSGDWTHNSLVAVEKILAEFSRGSSNKTVVWHVADVAEVDSAGMMLFVHYLFVVHHKFLVLC